MTFGKKNTCCQELQYPEASSDTEDSVFVESSWHGYQKGRVKDLKESWRCIKLPPPQNLKESISRGSPDLLPVPDCEKSTENKVLNVALQESTEVESSSSDDEFESLIERIRKRNIPRKRILSTSKTVYQPSKIGKQLFLANLQANVLTARALEVQPRILQLNFDAIRNYSGGFE